MLRTLLFNEPNERATPGAENTAIKQRPVDVYIFDAKLINYIYIICAGGEWCWIKYFINARNFGKAHILSILKTL